ncbi:aminoacyl-histidine dipeptidase [candidate division KSB1 bacterium]|nr:aminoacyl-histidine dipeptidase [candidate division KSB1 bacterium]
MDPVLQNLKPELLWKHFDEIRKIPHGSGKETAIGEYVKSVAKANHCEVEADEVGNVVIRKPASKGFEKAEIVILQGHLDMVCEKNSDVEFDFDMDPIQLQMDGEWLMAKGTTLGADNGIGVAASLAVLEDPTLVHGPLELLFTVDEETGLTGAGFIKPGFVKGRKYLNLDSEEEGVFTIGCSGGADSITSLPVKKIAAPAGNSMCLKIAGLKGGHSGLDINAGRGNAIKLLTRILWKANEAGPIALAAINGGNKRNAIAREATAEIIVALQKVDAVKQAINTALVEIKNEFKAIEKDLRLDTEVLKSPPSKVLADTSKIALLRLLYGLPHGVLAMSKEIEGLVETSTNLAIVTTAEDAISIGQSSRSSLKSALAATRTKLKALAELAGATVDQPEGYPGWAPNLSSEILKISKQVYADLFGKEPQLAAIHAGLECGIIGEKFPGMDMVSFGPDLKNPHSPDEKVNVRSVDLFWKHLVGILEYVAKQA